MIAGVYYKDRLGNDIMFPLTNSEDSIYIHVKSRESNVHVILELVQLEKYIKDYKENHFNLKY